MNPTDQLWNALADRYVVDREIGAGGMATVYLARDVKHNRKVALKVLKPELGAVLGVERFLAEIEVTANLQHPNLLPLFDSGEVGGLLFYVMPYIEGESLRARLDREKQLPVDEAVRLAVAIANALDYAHRHGVIHRDLKPENVLLHEGQPLVTDFGIALAVSNAGGNRITQTGLSLGTPQYMSPEQATGDRALDARTDVYSLGAMLYEMLVGDPPHMASTSQAVIAKVLTERAASVRVARSAVPEYVEYAVSRALEKLPADRWTSAAELASALEGKAAIVRPMTLAGAAAGPASLIRSRSRATLIAAGAATLLAGAGLGAWAWAHSHQPPMNGAVRFVVNFPLALNPMAGGAGAELAITPDGKYLIYRVRGPAGAQLARRPMDQLTPTLIAGTEGVIEQAISPDGKWVAFLTGTGASTALKKVAIEGGTPTTLAAKAGMGAMTWGSNGTIVFADSAGLFSVAASSGSPRLLAGLDTARGEVRVNWPRFLPDGKTILYTSFLRGASIADARIGVAPAGGGRTTTLDLPGMFPLGMVDGNVIYARADGPLMAAKVDLARGRVLGEPTVLEEGVRFGTAGASKSAMSQTGTLVYKPGSGFGGDVALVDMQGGITPLFEPKDGSRPEYPAFSPDGKRVAITLLAANGRLTLWTYDLAGKSLTRLTSDSASDTRPSWSADPARVYFLSDRRVANERASSRFRLWEQAADGSAPPALVADVGGHGEAGMTRDGRGVVFRPQGAPGLWYKNLAGDTAAKPLLTNPAFTYDQPSLSPDGHWLAYRSNETGVAEIYVRAFPGPPSKILVSSGGGDEPRWAPNGQTIYYRSLASLIAASVTTKPAFAVVSRAVVPTRLGVSNFSAHQNYDVSPDGKRFVLISSLPADSTGAMIAVVNWFDEVRARLANR